jgi:chromosomal replication initiation ATPase DnaA
MEEKLIKLQLEAKNVPDKHHEDPMLKYNYYSAAFSPDCKINLDDVLAMVCQFFEVTSQEVKSRSKESKYSIARKFYFYLARELTPYKTVEIGYRVRRSHSDVITQSKLLKMHIKIYPEYREMLSKLKSKLVV